MVKMTLIFLLRYTVFKQIWLLASLQLGHIVYIYGFTLLLHGSRLGRHELAVNGGCL